MLDEIEFSCREFGSLSAPKVYDILRLRAEVFIVEQNCAFLDPDGDDLAALHITGCCKGRLLAYARLLPPGIRYPGCSIGRVSTSKEVRGTGLGRDLVHFAIGCSRDYWPNQPIIIAAQLYLEQFYLDLGFVTESKPFLDDGIMHLLMRLETAS